MEDTIQILTRRISLSPPTDGVSNLTGHPPPPVTTQQLAEFTCRTGLRLPLFLTRLYSEVANGGFGPAWGINPIDGDDSLASWDLFFRNANACYDEPCTWPAHLLRFCELGCTMYYGVDPAIDTCPVYRVDPNQGSLDGNHWCTLVENSVESWLRSWAMKPHPCWVNKSDNNAMNTEPPNGCFHNG